MSESPDQRRERLVQAVADGLDVGREAGADALDALLAALESPVAEMVRRGVESWADAGYPLPFDGYLWYRPTEP